MTEVSATAGARAAIAQLVRAGVSTFILCPGSRSAPLAWALVDAEAAGVVTLHVEVDERVAGFVALGVGKAGKLAAVVTTSGSAVANLHPALEEAKNSGVPILVVSADRPHELRGVRASQTTDHLAVLAGSVLTTVDVPAGTATRAADGLLRRAVRAATRGRGPVHVNLGFREPLVPDAPWGSVVADCAATESAPTQKRTVIVSGPTSRAEALDVDIAAGIPVLSEPSGELRGVPSAVTAHPILLETALRSEIERVVVFGHPTLTRQVASLLADPDVEVLAVDGPAGYTDVSGNARVVDLGEVGPWLTADADWLARWKAASDAAALEISERLDGEERLTFPAIGRILGAATIPHCGTGYMQAIRDAEESGEPVRGNDLRVQHTPHVRTVLGASSTIREVNLFATCPSAPLEANRGLAGIDGTVSTGIGIALASGEPVRVVLGDLAFIHDLGALVATQGQESVPVDVVVIDDHGGSLFAMLEHGEQDPTGFDRAFRTAKRLDVEAFAKSVGVDYLRISSPGELWTLGYPERPRIVHADLGWSAPAELRAARAELLSAIREAAEKAL